MDRTYPPKWEKFCELNSQYPNFSLFGMHSDIVIADANRFAARYRMIRDLDTVKVNGAKGDTEDGYTALLRLLFVWGGAETVFELSGIDINKKRKHFLNAYDQGKLTALYNELNQLRPEVEHFFTVIKEKSYSSHVTEIDNFLSNQQCDPSYLLSGIRHSFSHGTLSPNTGTKNARITVKICNLLTEFFTDLIEEQFITIVKQHPHY